MGALVQILLLLVAIIACSKQDSPNTGSNLRYITNATKIQDEFVGRLSLGEHSCSGTLINPCTVLTATHCLEFAPKGDFITSTAKSSFHSFAHATAQDSQTKKNTDLSLLRLNHKLNPKAAMFQGFPQIPSFAISPGTEVNILGFSSNGQGIDKSFLRMGTAIAGITARAQFPNLFNAGAAGEFMELRETSAKNKVCPGDSGGPTLYHDFVVGSHSVAIPASTYRGCVVEIEMERETYWGENWVSSRSPFSKRCAHFDPEKGFVDHEDGCLDARLISTGESGSGLVWYIDETNGYPEKDLACNKAYPKSRFATPEELKNIVGEPAHHIGFTEEIAGRRYYGFVWLEKKVSDSQYRAIDTKVGESKQLNKFPTRCERTIAFFDTSVAPYAQWLEETLQSDSFQCEHAVQNWLHISGTGDDVQVQFSNSKGKILKTSLCKERESCSLAVPDAIKVTLSASSDIEFQGSCIGKQTCEFTTENGKHRNYNIRYFDIHRYLITLNVPLGLSVIVTQKGEEDLICPQPHEPIPYSQVFECHGRYSRPWLAFQITNPTGERVRLIHNGARVLGRTAALLTGKNDFRFVIVEDSTSSSTVESTRTELDTAPTDLSETSSTSQDTNTEIEVDHTTTTQTDLSI